jgi:hypothetical protein
MHDTRVKLVLLTAVVFLAHCSDTSPSDKGDAGSSSDLGSPGRPDMSSSGVDLGPHSAAFTAVQAIFDQYCITCHDASLPIRPEGGSYPALPLTADASYAALVGKSALETCGGVRVTPGAPSNSYLVQKVSDPSPCEGMRMPRAGNALPPPPLSAQDIAVITSWIQAGAPY